MTKQVVVQDYDRKTLEEIHDSSKDAEVWSPSQIRLLGEASPLTVIKINERLGTDFDVNGENLEEQAKALASYVVCTMDNHAFKGSITPNFLRRKIRNLQRMYAAVGEDCEVQEDWADRQDPLDLVYSLKMLAISFLQRYVGGYCGVERVEPTGSNGLADFFSGLLGQGLDRIFEFGSSLYGKSDDRDLILSVDEITRETYDAIAGQKKNAPDGLPPSLILLPSTALKTYGGDYGHVLPRSFKMIHGEGTYVPVVSEKDYVRNKLIKEMICMVSLNKALGDTERQETMVERPSDLKATLKMELWVSKSLMQYRMGRYLTKQEFLDIDPVRIDDVGMNPSAGHVKRALLDANYRLKVRVDEYMSHKEEGKA
ncbi:MAG: hypothetical protein KJ709_02275 [Nanoarchaeota archaeon]|nr:hypothetical protein [Nanoarchaeota archaeon]